MEKNPQRTPLEQLFAIASGRRRMSVGVPSDDYHRRRVPLTPEGAAMLVQREIGVRIQQGAGADIHYTDNRYRQAGADIVSRAEALAADIVISLSPLSGTDLRHLRRGTLLLTFLDSLLTDADALRVLLERNIITVALDRVADRDGHTPFADVLNEIDGRAAMAAASALLADAGHGKGILLGGVAGIIPCEVTVIGAGIAGMAAARSAIGMGAMVRIFDTDIYRLRRAAELLGSGAVASAMHPRVVVNALRSADVVIVSQMSVPHTVDADVVEEMKGGVVTVSLHSYGDAVPEGPVFVSMPTVDLGETGMRPVRDLDGSTPRVCYTNPAAAVPRTVAMALSNTITGMFDEIISCGAGTANTFKLHPGMQRAVCTFAGRPVNTDVAAVLGMRPVDIRLLLQFS